MNRDEYFILKKYIKSICFDNAKDIASNVGLNDYETRLLLSLNKDNTRVATSMDMGICPWKYSQDLKKIINKIYDYKKRG